MGADLYMEKSYQKRMQKHIKELDKLKDDNKQEEATALLNYLHNDEVYFRDSYNSGNTLWAMNLSWWTDVLPMLDDQGFLGESGIIKLLSLIKRSPLHVSEDFSRDIPNEWTRSDAMKFLHENRNKLIYFLNQSLLRKERIFCSL